jgi:PKD repeat protein/nitrous oxidase accessory protein NosD
VGLLALVLAGASLAMLGSPAGADHGGDAIIVDADGSGDFTAIQPAIDHAEAGDTILVNDGVYEEAVTVDVEDLTLAADQPDVTVRYAPADAPTGTPTIDVQAPGVTVDGFTVERVAHEDRLPTSPHAQGIAVRASDVNVTQNHVVGEAVSAIASPVADWTLDEDAGATTFADAENDHDATCDAQADACPTAGVAGAFGQAARFDGTDDALAADSLSGFEAGTSFTVETWFKLEGSDAANSWPRLVSQGNSGTSNGAWSILVNGDGGDLGFRAIDDTGTTVDTWANSVDLDDGEFHQVVVTVEGDKITLSLDGQQVGTSQLDAPIRSTDDPIEIGNANDRRPFDGVIDEVTLYDTPIDEEAINGEQPTTALSEDYQRFDGIMIIDEKDAGDVSIHDNLVEGFHAGIVATSFYDGDQTLVHELTVDGNLALANAYGFVAKHHTTGAQPEKITLVRNDFTDEASGQVPVLVSDGSSFQGYDSVQPFNHSQIQFLVQDGDSIQQSLDNAPAGFDVYVEAGGYREALTIQDESTTLCSTSDGWACDGSADGTTISTVAAAPVIGVTADDVAIDGFTVTTAADGSAIDASGVTGVEVADNVVEIGLDTEDEFALQAAADPQNRDYWLDDFVQEMLTGEELSDIAEQRSDDEGLLSVVPVTEPSNHVGLYYEGEAPEAAHDMAADAEDPEIQVHEDAGEFQPLIQQDMHEEYPDRIVHTAEEAQELAPEQYQGIRPGALTEHGSAGCTANWIWTDADKGEEITADNEIYLGTAGHCIAEGTYHNQEDDAGVGGDYDPRLPMRVCIANCSTGTPNSEWVTVADSPDDIAFARGYTPSPTDLSSTRPSDDFAIVEIPDEVRHLVESKMPYWGSHEGERLPNYGDPVTIYGHGAGVGEAFATEARTGVFDDSDVWGSEVIRFLAPTSFGDSGSAVGIGTTGGIQPLEGHRAAGLNTHGSTAASTSPAVTTAAGPSIQAAVSDVSEWGVRDWPDEDPIRPVDGTEAIPLPFDESPDPPEVSLLDVSTSQDAQVEVSWELPADSAPADWYRVLRDGEQIANTTDTSLVDTGAEEGVEHCYQVVAGNQLGESAPSTETCLTPTLASLPSLSFLEAEDRQRGDEIGLLWSLDGDASEIDHYRVERAGPNGTEVIATPSPDAESFVDDELEQDAEYTYTVRTVSADDTSAPSSASAVPTTGTASWSQPQADGEATGFAGVGGDIQVPEIAATADAEGSISASPVVGDITGDGDREIVVVTETTADQDSQGLRVVAYSFDDGQLTEEWRHVEGLPVNAPEGYGQLALADLDGDGVDEVAAKLNYEGSSDVGGFYGGTLYAFDGDGSQLGSAPLGGGDDGAIRVAQLADDGSEHVLTTDEPFAGKLVGYTLDDGTLTGDIDVTANDNRTGAGPVLLDDDQGPPSVAFTTSESAAMDADDELFVCDITDDGGLAASCEKLASIPGDTYGISTARVDATERPSIVVNGGAQTHVLDPEDGSSLDHDLPQPAWNDPAVADLTGDAASDIVGAGYDEDPASADRGGDVFALDVDGSQVQTLGTVERAPATNLSRQVPGGPAIADITGDGELEAVVGDESGAIEAVPVDALATDSVDDPAWTVPGTAPIRAPVAVADVTGDDTLDVVAANQLGEVVLVDDLEQPDTPSVHVGIEVSSTTDAVVEANDVTAHGDDANSLGIVASGGGAEDGTVRANDVSVETAGILAGSGSEGMLIADNQVHVEAGWCSTQGLDLGAASPHEAVCSKPHVRGVQVGDAVTVRGNAITSDTVLVQDDGEVEVTGSWGVNVLGAGATVEDNDLSGWGVAGVALWGHDAQIEANTFAANTVGVHVATSPGETSIADNQFEQNGWAVRFAGASSSSVDRAELRHNDFAGNGYALWLDNSELTVDARLNDWGTYDHRLIDARIQDDGEDNTVLRIPFLDENGEPEPGLVTIQGEAGEYVTIQDAVTAADAGDQVLVPQSDAQDPTPRREAVTLSTPSVGVCSTSSGSACDGDREAAIVDATDRAPTVVDVQAGDATIEGLTLAWDGELTENVNAVRAAASGTLVQDAVVQLPAEGCAPALEGSDCGPLTAGVRAENATTVDQVSFEAQPSDAEAATWAVYTDTDEPVTVDQVDATGWTVGVSAQAPDTVVRDSTFEAQFTGVHLSADDARVDNNTFVDGNSAVYIAGGDALTQTDVVLRHNEMGATADALLFQAAKTDAEIDARLNHWGALGEDAIEETRIGNLEDNGAEIEPYLDANGDEHPPRPEVRCYRDGAFQTVTRTLGLQEAVDAELPGDCQVFGDDDAERRQIILFDDLEDYEAATVDELATITGLAVNTSANGLATIEAEDGSALRFETGSADSRVSDLNVHTGEQAPAIEVDGADGITLDRTENALAVADGVRVMGPGAGTGLEAANASQIAVTGATFKGLDRGIVLDNAEEAAIADTDVAARAIGILAGPDSVDLTVESTQATGAADDAATGLELAGPHATVQNSTVRAWSTGIAVDGDETTVENSELTANGVGIDVTGDAAELAGNAHDGDEVAVTVRDAADVLVEDLRATSVDAAVDLRGASSPLVENALVSGSQTGVRVAPADDIQPRAVTVNNSRLGLAETPLHLVDGTEDVSVDATCNDWGVYYPLAIEQRIQDDGEDNEVEYNPWIGPTPEATSFFGCLVQPVADFSYEPDLPSRPDEINFTDESRPGSAPIVEWIWEFGDGTTARTPNATHSYDEPGIYQVNLTVRDANGMESNASKLVKVVNLAPELDTPADIAIPHTEDIAFDVEAEDPEGDQTNLGAEGRPLQKGANWSVEGQDTPAPQGTFNWTEIEPQDRGLYEMNFTAVDDYGNATQDTVFLEIIDDRPEIDAVTNPTTRLEHPVSFDVAASDANGDPVHLEADGVPDNATFEITDQDTEEVQASFNWTPTDPDAVGTHDIVLTAEAEGLETEHVVKVEVGEENVPPEITVERDGDVVGDNLKAVSGQQLSLDVLVEDPDGEEIPEPEVAEDPSIDSELTVTDVTTENGEDCLAGCNLTAEYDWTPADQTEPVDVEVTAADGFGEVNETFTIDVIHPPDVESLAPHVEEPDRATEPVLVGESFRPRADVSDLDEDLASVAFTVSHLTISASLQDGVWVADQAVPVTLDDNVTYEITAEDDEGLTTTVNDTVHVETNPGPVAAVVENPVNVTGGVEPVELNATPSNHSYNRSISFSWTLPADGSGSTDGALAEWIPPEAGVYTANVTVTDTLGATDAVTVEIVVEDAIIGQADMPSHPDREVELTERPTASVYVVDEIGMPIGGADVNFTVYHDTLGEMTQEQRRTADDGVRSILVPFDTDTEPGANLQGAHELEIVMSTESDMDATPDVIETTSVIPYEVVVPTP